MEKKSLFTTMTKGKARTYFFDIREASNGTPYISICESHKKKDEDGYERNRVLLFADDFDNFMDGVKRVAVYWEENLVAEEAAA